MTETIARHFTSNKGGVFIENGRSCISRMVSIDELLDGRRIRAPGYHILLERYGGNRGPEEDGE